jgi:hypothetical protein
VADEKETWVEVDLTPGDEGKAPAKPTIEFQDDSPPPEREREKPQAREQQDGDETAGVETEGAQRRIKKLVAQRKAKEAELAEERREKAELKARLEKLEKLAVDGAAADAEAYKSTLQQNVDLHQRAYEEAFKSGDAEGAATAMRKLVKSQMELEGVEQGTARVRKSKTEADEEGGSEGRASPRQRTEAPRVHPRVQEFIEENEAWWGKDTVMTAAAAAIARDLEKDGLTADDDEYYEEVRGRLKAEFPNKFGAKAKGDEGRRTQTLGGVSRGSAPNRVRLSASEQSIAKRLGLTNEQYAVEVRRLNSQAGGYTEIQ